MLRYLKPRGYLILGHSEHVPWLNDSVEALGTRSINCELRSGHPTPGPSGGTVHGDEERTGEQRPAPTDPASSRLPMQRRRIYIGEIVASATPMLLQTLLGSCVAVCLRDPVTCIGGMNHILLPGRCDGDDRPSRCGVHAMELLINAIMKEGGDRRRLVAKVFGAGTWSPVFRRRPSGN